MKIITFAVNEADYELLQQTKRQGGYYSRSLFLREAVKMMAQKILGKTVPTGTNAKRRHSNAPSAD